MLLVQSLPTKISGKVTRKNNILLVPLQLIVNHAIPGI
jgi:hypothetical protein